MCLALLVVLHAFQDTKLRTLKSSFDLLQNFSIIWICCLHISSCLGPWNNFLTNPYNSRDPSLSTNHFKWRLTFIPLLWVSLWPSRPYKNLCSLPDPSTNICIYTYRWMYHILNIKSRGESIAEMFLMERKKRNNKIKWHNLVEIQYVFSLCQILENSENDILTSSICPLMLHIYLCLLIINISNCLKNH